jgi:hypothetical protein
MKIGTDDQVKLGRVEQIVFDVIAFRFIQIWARARQIGPVGEGVDIQTICRDLEGQVDHAAVTAAISRLAKKGYVWWSTRARGRRRREIWLYNQNAIGVASDRIQSLVRLGAAPGVEPRRPRTSDIGIRGPEFW